MLVAILILLAILTLSVAIPRLNAGLLGLVCALFLGPFLLKGSTNEIVLQLFPTQLFLTLFGVTFFFTSLHSTQLLDVILLRILGKFSRTPRLIPLILFLGVAILTALGLGNIAAVAFFAPLAIPLAERLGFSKLLMSVLVVGAANAASFSPLALPGIFVHSFLQKSSALSSKISPDIIQWNIFFSVFICISFVTAIGFFLFGGFRWWLAQKNGTREFSFAEQFTQSSTKLNETQLRAARVSVLVLGFFLTACLSQIPWLSSHIPAELGLVLNRLTDVGIIGWIGSLCLVLFKISDTEESLEKMPWSTILLVCGMSAYIELLCRLDVASMVARPLEQSISIPALSSVISFFAALVSAFASSVGVALPLFMPIVESLSSHLDASLVTGLIIAVAVGSHLVDASPLSTLGALCLAQVSDRAERNTLYRHLLFWGFALVPVSAVVGYFVYLVFL